MKTIHYPIATLAMLFALPAWAQTTVPAAPAPTPSRTAGTDSDDPTKDIIVTAQRTATSLQKTPAAVTALSGETLIKTGATSLLDVQNATPSLSVGARQASGSSRGSFAIRGIGVDANEGSAAVGIYVDEVYYPSAAGNLLGLFDVERVEVLRGPQGTLFGRNTIGGAVQFITAKPDQNLGGYVSGTVGTYDHYEVAGAINLPITDNLAIRLAGRYNDIGGFVYDRFNNVKRGAETTKQGRAALRWRPVDNLTIDLKGEIIDQTGNGRAVRVLAVNTAPPGDPKAAALLAAASAFGFNPATLANFRADGTNYRTSGFDRREDSYFKYRAGSANIAWAISDALTLKSITGYSFSDQDAFIDIDNTPLTIIGLDRGRVRDKLFSQELQASGKFLDDRFQYTLGGYYYRQDSLYTQKYQSFGTSPLIIPASSDYRTITTALAAYGQLTFKITDQLSVTGGLRYSDERVRSSFVNLLVPGLGAPTNLGVNPLPGYRNSFNDLSPSFGINFQANPDALIYVKASRGFRAGGVASSDALVNPPAPFPPITATPGYIPYQQETAWTYEAGTRLQFLNRRIRINPTIFYTDWKNIQFNSFVFNPTPQIITRNAGNARIWGLELELNAKVSKAFSLNYTFSYLNGKYTSVLPGAPVTLASELQRTPPVKFSLGGDYVIPLANGDRITANVNYAFTAEQRSATSDIDFIELPAFGLLNARLEYRLKNPNISLAVYATNLTNSYYYLGGSNGFTTFSTVVADVGRPREIGASIRVAF